MTFGSGVQSFAAQRRTFYIERHGSDYHIVKVWEAGATMSQSEVEEMIRYGLRSNPDERIIAEQQVGLEHDESGKLVIHTANLDQAEAVMQGMQAVIPTAQQMARDENL